MIFFFVFSFFLSFFLNTFPRYRKAGSRPYPLRAIGLFTYEHVLLWPPPLSSIRTFSYICRHEILEALCLEVQNFE